uniref:Large ribosomal subunit protein bL35c n=1 Tax=Dictyopteris divaricata TaxID=156996 RepID=A0A2I4Q2D2_9PHAE|nr:50S ribosomal protein L35 [Dictyopteris divaricata]YP_010205292.1 50S ribosomal protein L35 [Grateloupia livida]AQZ25003.1 50S ribosomal protein L35 [Dictyopteris divaricata]UAV85861.1 50S ribosomal protein L35 [Grateloupia livida]
MPKLKTKKAAKKRYKPITGKQFIRKKAYKSHLLEKKSTKRKRNLSNSILVSKGDRRAVKRMLAC